MSELSNRLPRLAIVTASALSLAALAIPLWFGSKAAPQPEPIDSPISARFEFARPGTTTGWRTIAPLERVEARNAFRLHLEMSEPLFVYILSFDFVRGHASMWPSSQLRSRTVELRDNQGRLRAGQHQLPGRDSSRELSWQTGESVGALDVFVVASRQKLEDFGAFLSRCRQVGNRAFPQERILDLYAPDEGMEVNPSRTHLDHPLLEELRQMQTVEHDGLLRPIPGQNGIFGTVLRLRTPVGPGSLDPRTELNERLGDLQIPTPPPPQTGR